MTSSVVEDPNEREEKIELGSSHLRSSHQQSTIALKPLLAPTSEELELCAVVEKDDNIGVLLPPPTRTKESHGKHKRKQEGKFQTNLKDERQNTYSLVRLCNCFSANTEGSPTSVFNLRTSGPQGTERTVAQGKVLSI
jgi:hypothetical protein